MGASTENTTVTCLSHEMKYKEVFCGKQKLYWLELQLVDEDNQPVSGLKVQLEYHPLATEAELAQWAWVGNSHYDPTPPPVSRTVRGWCGSMTCTGLALM